MLWALSGSAAFAQTGPAMANSPSARMWMPLTRMPAQVDAAPAWIRPSVGQKLALDVIAMGTQLAGAPLEGTPAANQPLIMVLIDPTGRLQAFSILESPIMEPGLARQFPEIKTIVGQGLDDPSATLRADITMQGFHAQVLSTEGDWYIDPYSRADNVHYTSYYKRDLKPSSAWACEGVITGEPEEQATNGPNLKRSSGTSLRTYRLANACTGEYAAFQGGTVALAQSAIVTSINRVTGVYERECAIRLVLVANNTSIVYTNSATDPYTNGNGSTMLTQNQTNLTTVIGSANYDIGHVFSTGGGGIASLGSVCVAARKAQGVTGSTSPVGDPYDIDYVAHEMGHQFGGNHCFNSVTGSCSGNRNASTAYEPGSASTIMGYAGICGADNLQPNSDAYFHTVSYDEINTYITSGGGSTCGTASATGNGIPSVSGPGNFTIPKSTPFFLTATGSDPNADALTYCWEERALGPSAALTAADDGLIPLVRSLTPSTSPTRFVPPLANVLANTTNAQQRLPSMSRTWPWRVTVRDNRAGGGGVNQADLTLTVAGAAGPFTVTSPSSAVSWPALSTQTITWNVAGTTANGINCANVAIDLSTDGGNTFPIVITASTPNSGSATVTIPNNQTTNGRIRVRGVNNIFYNVNQGGAVTITAPITGVNLAGTGANTFSDSTGNGNANGRIDPGETAITVTVPIINTGTVGATNVSGTLVSNTPTVTVTTATASYANLAANGGTASNATPYIINVSPSHVCGAPISLTLNISSTQGTGSYAYSFSTGLVGGPVTQTFTYSGPAVAIPDSNATGASATLAVSGLSGAITDVNFRFNGTSCNATAGSTTVGLDHTYVGDLTITLQSPTGTIVTLVSNAGGTGQNFCNTVLDDSAATSIQSIAASGNPYSGTYAPNSPLSAFNGLNPNGTWTLKAVDSGAVDTGNIRAFSIIITALSPTTCTPPNSVICPAVTGQPASVSACAGESASFTVIATGTPTPTYQWRKNGVNIPSATLATYTIPNVTMTDAGPYTCVVTNTCGSVTSFPATLTVDQCRCSPADIAYGDGEPLPPIGLPGGVNPVGPDGGDFDCFFNFYFAPAPDNAACDIAYGDGEPLPPFGPAGGVNPGVDGGDFDCFFNFYFSGCV